MRSFHLCTLLRPASTCHPQGSVLSLATEGGESGVPVPLASSWCLVGGTASDLVSKPHPAFPKLQTLDLPWAETHVLTHALTS